MKAKNLRFVLTITIVFFAHLLIAQTPAEEHRAQWANFKKMSAYLTKGSGKWTGENKNYNPNNPRSARAFGLWFEKPLSNLLTLKIVSYKNDTTILSSQGTFSWHPTNKQYVHIMADRGNGYSEGFTEFPNDSTFISTMINYRPNGRIFDHKDENFIVNENTHRNVSYEKDQQGNWKESGSWVWTRDLKK